MTVYTRLKTYSGLFITFILKAFLLLHRRFVLFSRLTELATPVKRDSGEDSGFKLWQLFCDHDGTSGGGDNEEDNDNDEDEEDDLSAVWCDSSNGGGW